MEEKTKLKYELKKQLTHLKSMKGSGTELISVYGSGFNARSATYSALVPELTPSANPPPRNAANSCSGWIVGMRGSTVHGQAAAHAQHLAGDVPAQVRTQEQHGSGDVARLANEAAEGPPRGRLTPEALAGVVRLAEEGTIGGPGVRQVIEDALR